MIDIDDPTKIQPALQRIRQGFATGRTRDVCFRERQLKNLLQGFEELEKEMAEGLRAELNHSDETAYLFSFSLTKASIKDFSQRLRARNYPRKVFTSPLLWPARSRVVPEPLGVSLVMGTWNYPYYTTIVPAAASIAAGNAVLVKPSELSPHSSRLMKRLFDKYMDPDVYQIIEGQAEVAKSILRERFDLIIFTGSPEKGKMVAKAAAEHLTPCILELGGKSPCIVDEDCDLEESAKRIVFGKLVNAGQTCIGVDYVLAHESIKDDLINHLKREVETQYGIDPSKSPYYQRIVDINHTKRIARLLQKENHGGKIQFGGEVNLTDRYISPTIIDEPRANSALMKEEIFGPLLPVLKYKSINYAIKFVNEREKPLALYYFGAKNKQKVLHETSSRAFSANDTLMYMLNNALPFGGVGFSGMSRLHGDYAIDSCSHLKACFDRKIIPYPPFSWSFPPYNNPKRFRLMRWALNMLK